MEGEAHTVDVSSIDHRSKAKGLRVFGFAFSALWVSGAVALLIWKWSKAGDLDLSEWDDFAAGAKELRP